MVRQIVKVNKYVVFSTVYIFYYIILLNWSRVSSGSIVSDYGLDDRVIGV
jgi:hypothetical protein